MPRSGFRKASRFQLSFWQSSPNIPTDGLFVLHLARCVTLLILLIILILLVLLILSILLVPRSFLPASSVHDRTLDARITTLRASSSCPYRGFPGIHCILYTLAPRRHSVFSSKPKLKPRRPCIFGGWGGRSCIFGRTLFCRAERLSFQHYSRIEFQIYVYTASCLKLGFEISFLFKFLKSISN